MVQGLGRSDAQAGVGREAPIQQVKHLAFVRARVCVLDTTRGVSGNTK
jgi:hypothetical protein